MISNIVIAIDKIKMPFHGMNMQTISRAFCLRCILLYWCHCHCVIIRVIRALLIHMQLWAIIKPTINIQDQLFFFLFKWLDFICSIDAKRPCICCRLNYCLFCSAIAFYMVDHMTSLSIAIVCLKQFYVYI